VSSQVGWLAGSGLLSEDELQELLALGPVLAGKQEVYHLKNLIVGTMPSIADDRKRDGF
jgi:hypothetical protein